jgi:hypothetical protein
MMKGVLFNILSFGLVLVNIFLGASNKRGNIISLTSVLIDFIFVISALVNLYNLLYKNITKSENSFDG